MQLITIPPIRPALGLAIAHLKNRSVICYPTDTLYGIGGDARLKSVVERISKIKGRDRKVPYSVIFSDWEMGSRYVKIDQGLRVKLEELTPGPYTFLLEKKRDLPVTESPLLGCRVPDNEFCLKLVEEFGHPIITTSSNTHKKDPATDVSMLDEKVSNSLDLIIDQGRTMHSKGSTIIDVVNKKIIREGAGLMRAERWILSL